MNVKLCVFNKFVAVFSASLIFSTAFFPANAVKNKPTADKSTAQKSDANNKKSNDKLNKNSSFFHISNIKLNNSKILLSQKIINDSNILFKSSSDQAHFLNKKRENDSLGMDLMVSDSTSAKKKKFDFCGADCGSEVLDSEQLVDVCLQKSKNDIKDMVKIFCDVSSLRSAIKSYLDSPKGSNAWKKNAILVGDCLKKLTFTYETSTIFNIPKHIEATYIILLELKKIKNDENLTNDPNYKLIFAAVRSNLYEYISKKLENIFSSTCDKNECKNHANSVVDSIFNDCSHIDNIFDYAYDELKILNMLDCAVASHLENLFYEKLQSVQNKKDAICREMAYICSLISQLKSALNESEEQVNNKELIEKLTQLLKKNIVYLTEMITGCNGQKMISCRLNTICETRHFIYPLESFNEDYNRYKSGKDSCELELFKILKEADINDDCASFNLDECVIFDPLVDDYERKKDLTGSKFFVLPPQRIDKFNKNSEPDLNEKKKILSSIHKFLEKSNISFSNKEYNNTLLNSTSFRNCLDEILLQIDNMKKLYQ